MIDWRADAYSLLSMEVGVFAGVADGLLGRHRFMLSCRARAHELTPELLADWKAEAVEAGVPADEMERRIADVFALLA